MNIMKEPKFIVFIVLTAIILVIAILDVDFVFNKKVVTGDGVILLDETKANNLIAALDAKNIPYKLDTSDGRFSFTWDLSYSSVVESIKQDVMGYAAPGKKGTCFFENETRQKLAAKLERAAIKYELKDYSNGDLCIYWAPQDDEKVAELYPVLKEMRKLEAQRRADQM